MHVCVLCYRLVSAAQKEAAFSRLQPLGCKRGLTAAPCLVRLGIEARQGKAGSDQVRHARSKEERKAKSENSARQHCHSRTCKRMEMVIVNASWLGMELHICVYCMCICCEHFSSSFFLLKEKKVFISLFSLFITSSSPPLPPLFLRDAMH